MEHIKRKTHAGTAWIGNREARSIAGRIDRAKSRNITNVIRHPVRVLCFLGLLKLTERHRFDVVKKTATYALEDGHKPRKVRLALTRSRAKRHHDPQRWERLSNQRYCWRERFVVDLAKIQPVPAALPLIPKLLHSTKEAVTKRALGAFAPENARKVPLRVRVDSSGTIQSNWNSVPPEFKAALGVDDEALVEADITAAHFCFLPLLLNHGLKLRWFRESEKERVELELRDLRAALSDDFYASLCCSKPGGDGFAADREKLKKTALMALNMPNEKRLPILGRLGARYPFTMRAVRRMKRRDHRAIGCFLRGHLADAMQRALKTAQDSVSVALPDTDALWVLPQDHATAARIIGEEIMRRTGVMAKVGGIRFVPQ